MKKTWPKQQYDDRQRTAFNDYKNECMRTERRRTDEQQTNDQPQRNRIHCNSLHRKSMQPRMIDSRELCTVSISSGREVDNNYVFCTTLFFSISCALRHFIPRFLLIHVFNIHTWINLPRAILRRCFIHCHLFATHYLPFIVR